MEMGMFDGMDSQIAARTLEEIGKRAAKMAMENQRQMAMQQAQSLAYANSGGSGMGGYTTGHGTLQDQLGSGNWGIASQPTNYPTHTHTIEPPPRRMSTSVKFFRLHKEVELEEGGEYVEPLDRLRIAVSRWLGKSGERRVASGLNLGW